MAALTQVAELEGFYGPRVAAGSEGVWAAASPVGLAVWKAGELTLEQSPGGLLGEICFAADGRRLLAAPFVFDLETRAFEPLPPLAPALADGLGGEAERGFAVHASAWSPDGSQLAVYAEYRPPRELGRTSSYAGPEKRLLLLEGETRRVERVLWEGGGWESYRALALDGGRVAAATAAISVWERAGAGRPLEAGRHGAAVRALRFSHDGALLASVSADGEVGIFDAVDGAELRRWAAHDDDALALDLHPGGAVLATGAFDGSLRLWSTDGDLLGGEQLDGAVEGVAFAAGGEELLVARGAPRERLLVFRLEL